MLFACLLNQAHFLRLAHGYFILLKWVVTVCSGWICYDLFSKKPQSRAVLVFVLIALLFNPIVPVSFHKDTWVVIDIITAIIFGVYLAKDYNKTTSNNFLLNLKIKIQKIFNCSKAFILEHCSAEQGVLYLYLISLAFVCTYVPWREIEIIDNVKMPGASVYAWISTSMKSQSYKILGEYDYYIIDVKRIVLKSIALTAIFAVVFLILRKRKG